LIKKAEELKKKLSGIGSVEIDFDENKSPGEKFNYWEMKGVPIRIDLGMKELEEEKVTVFRRDLDKKETISEVKLLSYVERVKKENGKNLRGQADKVFRGKIKDARNVKEMKKLIEEGSLVRCNFCSIGKDGEKCAAVVEKEVGAKVRGTKLVKENANGKCFGCGKRAREVVYIAKDY